MGREQGKGRIFSSLFLGVTTLLLLAATHFYLLLVIPAAGKGEAVLVNIEPGSAISRVGRMLEEKGLIPSARVFAWYARLRGASVLAGEYRLRDDMSAFRVLDILQKGRTHLYKVTVPEGFSSRQIALLLEKQDLVKAEEFMAAVRDPVLARELLGENAPGLEGYLFPDTYHFARGVSAQGAVRAMAERFTEVFDEDCRRQAAKLGYTIHQIVTLASLVEKETAVAEERPLIGAVYHNRLQKGIRLQCDPTVIYALELKGDFDGNIRRADLDLDSPYNTYKYKGLPPGPIANPGRESLLAALYPAREEFVYFVSRNDGTHKFSKKLDEHNRAVYKYQKLPNRKKAR